MDPNATLQTIRALTRTLLNEETNRSDAADLAVELAEACENLDTWLSRGGFLPSRWEAAAIVGKDA